MLDDHAVALRTPLQDQSTNLLERRGQFEMALCSTNTDPHSRRIRFIRIKDIRVCNLDATVLQRVAKRLRFPVARQGKPEMNACAMCIDPIGQNGSGQCLPGTRFYLNFPQQILCRTVQNPGLRKVGKQWRTRHAGCPEALR